MCFVITNNFTPRIYRTAQSVRRNICVLDFNYIIKLNVHLKQYLYLHSQRI